MHSAFTPFVACCRQNYVEVQGAVDNRKTSCLSKVLEDGRLGPSAKAIAAGTRLVVALPVPLVSDAG